MSIKLRNKIQARQAKIAVIGLGYVGLPLAVNFAKSGFKVYGLDKDQDRVQKVNRCISYILDVPAAELKKVIRQGQLEASTEFEVLSEIDVIIICVPTPIKRKYTPDISYMISAVRTIRKYFKKDTLIILESTTYPGTTRELIKPELEKTGLKSEKDFFLAFSPERIDPGNKTYDVKRIPKIVGGIGRASGLLARTLYEKIITRVHLVSTAEAAEMTKLLENSFRIVNIGWINELAMICHQFGIDVWEVIEAAKTKPFGFMPFYPGLGVGGHCIPEDPLYLYWKARHYGFYSRFIKLAADINSSMPWYARGRLKDILRKKSKTLSASRILVMGVTYKRDVKDLRKSPSLKLIELLKKARCRVDYHDPIIPYLNVGSLKMSSRPLTKNHLVRYDCVVIATDHTQVNYLLVRQAARLIFDIRNVYGQIRDKKIIRF